jgi:hypothetical protein
MVLLATDPRPAASPRCSRSGTAHRSASGSARDGSGRRSARFRSRPELRSARSPLRSARFRGRRRPSPTQICRAPLQESVDIKGPGSANAEERLVSVDEGVGAIFVRVCFRIPFLRATEINTDRDRRQTWNRT